MREHWQFLTLLFHVVAEIGCSFMSSFALSQKIVPELALGVGRHTSNKRIFDDVANYSSFGSSYVAPDNQSVPEQPLKNVIDSLGISCPAGGTTNQLFRV